MANEMSSSEQPLGAENTPLQEGFLKMSPEDEKRRSAFLTGLEKIKIAVLELDKESKESGQVLELLNQLSIDYELACASGNEGKKIECERALGQLKSNDAKDVLGVFANIRKDLEEIDRKEKSTGL